MSDHLELPCIVASRGRNPDNPKSRKSGLNTEQQLELNRDGVSNCVTTVAKDNWIIEPMILKKERTVIGKKFRKQYESKEISMNRKEISKSVPRTDGCTNTITTVQKDNYLVEPVDAQAMVAGNYTKCGHESGRVVDSVKDYSDEINCSLDKDLADKESSKTSEHTYPFRLRKLTPKECWRLQGFDDEDIDKCSQAGVSDSQLYKQAGNSIAVNCLCAIFQKLFGIPCDSMPTVDVESRLF